MKIFCIGFQKTGTTSMGQALQELGFSVAGVQSKNHPHLESEIPRLIDGVVPRYDAFQDNPWPLLYRRLDERYPGSKFILTLREEASWLKSIVRHCGDRSTEMRKWIYGSGNPSNHESDYLGVYRRHNEEVQTYFERRSPSDFLILNLFDGDGWDELCSFLGIPEVPSWPFPHLNRALDRRLNRRLNKKLGTLVFGRSRRGDE